jgi:hypothetical protein
MTPAKAREAIPHYTQIDIIELQKNVNDNLIWEADEKADD